MHQPFTWVHRQQIVDLARSNRLIAVYGTRDYVEAGGLVGYGVSLLDVWKRAAVYIVKIRGGASPGDLPMSSRRAAIPTAGTLRKRAVEDPAKIPAAAARSVHFRRPASSVPSSIPRCLAHVSKASPGLLHEAGAGGARHLLFIESPIFMDPPMS
jgi:hypothetical protein